MYPEKQITLKDGTPAVIRSARVSDAAALVQYLIATAGETEFILAYPDERASMTVESEERFIQGVIDDPHRLFLVCEVNGELAGNCELHYSPRRKVCHRGGIAIALYRKFWNIGIGTAMMEALIETARKEGLSSLRLEFVEGNTRARALYEKLGFRIVAMVPDSYRLSDGSKRAQYIMLLDLENA